MIMIVLSLAACKGEEPLPIKQSMYCTDFDKQYAFINSGTQSVNNYDIYNSDSKTNTYKQMNNGKDIVVIERYRNNVGHYDAVIMRGTDKHKVQCEYDVY